MAINVYTPFTADRSILTGGLALAQGVGGGLSGVGRLIEEQKKRGQLATTLRKTLGTAYPDRKGEFAEMGLEDLQGALKGEALKSAMEDRARAIRLDEAILQQHGVQTQGVREALANQEREPAFLGRMDQLMQPHLQGPEPVLQPPEAGAEGPADLVQPEGPAELQPGQPNLGALLRAAEETGYRPDLRGVLDDMIKSGGAASGNEPLRFEEDPVTGNRYARQGKSVLPSGINPAKQSTTADEMYDADGTLIGHRVPTGGGKFTFRPIKPAASGELLPVLDPTTRRPVPGLGMDAAGKVHDYRNIMQKSGLGAPASGPAGTQDNPHTPKTPSEAKKIKPGEWFTTPDGRVLQRK